MNNDPKYYVDLLASTLAILAFLGVGKLFYYFYNTHFWIRKIFSCIKSPWIETKILHDTNVDSRNPGNINQSTLSYYKKQGYTFFTRAYEHTLVENPQYQIVWSKNFKTGIKSKYVDLHSGVIVCRKEKKNS